MGAATSASPLYFTSFDIGAVLVCITCLVNMLLRRRFDKLQSKIFIIILIDLAITGASDTAADMIRAYATPDAISLGCIEFVGYIYFVAHVALAPLFFLYVLTICRESMSNDAVRNNVIGLPFYFIEIMALINPLTHWMYWYEPDLTFVRSWGVYAAYAIGILYFILGFMQLIRRWRALTKVKRRALTYFFVMAGVGIIVQLWAPFMRFELFAESLAVLGVLMFVENEEEFMETELGIYNRYALEMDLDMYEKTGLSCPVIAVRVTNLDSYSHIGGSTFATQFMAVALADFLKTVMPWYYVYQTGPARFVLANPRASFEEAREIAQRIADRFKQSWEYRDIDIDLHAVVALARMPEDLPTSADVFYLADTPMPPIAGKDVLIGEDLNYLMRRAEVERAVQRGLDEGLYEVYYQPIFNKDGRVRSAEALMRLHDRLLGEVPPFEFIEVAERMGLVEQIGDFALREVCAFLADGEPQRLGIAHISVNLSVIQCMQADFSVNADRILESYHIDPNLVSFEITESMAAGDFEFLRRMMGQLKQGGHRFAMDDYGSGYSNMHSLVTLDFDVVKIDKSVLWDAEKSEMGMVILQNGVNMMRDIGCEVLVEGVETEDQVRLLRLLGVDYYQGFYYAKPMPKREFIAFLRQVQ